MTAVRGQLLDGLDALRAELSVAGVMRLIERTARWVDPATFRLLPVWFPEHSRKGLFYKTDWSEPQMNRNRVTGVEIHKYEGNNNASKALTLALGLRSRDRPNWSCCHIWGVDDATFAATNTIVQDARYFSCVANMVLLPTPLKAFTDVMPEIKSMLRTCAFFTYGWRCEEEIFAGQDIEAAGSWPAYPASWPSSRDDQPPPGMMPLTDRIERDARKRLNRIRHDLDNAGPFYPREQVRAALTHWGIEL